MKRSDPEQVAVPSDDIAYEVKLVFNDVAGYAAKHEYPYVLKDPSRLAALPLTEFTTARNNRKQYLDNFLAWLQNRRYARVEGETSQGEESNHQTNEAVGTEDLLHFINSTLSPTASYILCTGRATPRGFPVSEKLVQKRSPTPAERNAYFQEKEDGLMMFFLNDPNSYTLVAKEVDPQGRRLFDVKFAIIEIDDSDDEGFCYLSFAGLLNSGS